MQFLAVVIFALSLCADCFAVSLCSSVTLKKVNWTQVLTVALSFAVIQTGLLLVGWAFGYLFLGFIGRVARWIGFALLLYVGGSMFLEGIKGGGEVRNLNGFRNIVIGGIATSIDALAVGASMSLSGEDWAQMFPRAAAVFIVTAISVIVGIFGGKTIGAKAGNGAEIVGGLVLAGIGVAILL